MRAKLIALQMTLATQMVADKEKHGKKECIEISAPDQCANPI